MPIFHLHSQHIGRSTERGAGRSAVAAAAYRSASLLVEEIVDKATGIVFEQVHDYRNKEGVFFSEILAPDRCALWMKDRETLWNFVQNKFDTRKNSVFSQEIDLALPVEFSRTQNLELLKEFANDTFIKEGIIVDTNVHYDNPENPHAHLMLSTREIVWDADIGDYTFGNKVRFWDTKEFLVQVRRSWARFVNEHLEKYGFDMEISHLSYKEQGIDLLPGIKEGIGRRVDGSDRAALNREIRAANAMRVFENPELIIDRLRKNKPVFTREDVAKELFSAYQEVMGDELVLCLEGESEIRGKNSLKTDYNDADITKYTCDLAKVMASKRLVCLGTKDLEGRMLYTSRVRFELEQDLLAKVDSIKNSVELVLGEGDQLDTISVGAHCLDVSLEDLDRKNVFEFARDKVAESLEKLGLLRRCSVVLSDKQKEVVLGVLNGESVSVVEGLPGAGKTTVMNAVARQYRSAGYQVIGAAVSASAASELGMVAGIKSMSITKLRYEIERIRGRRHDDFTPSLRVDYWQKGDEIYGSTVVDRGLLSSKTVLIVDEASMVDLTEMHFIMSEVARSGAKLVLLGDRGQLSSVGISGSFEMMAEHFIPLRLDEVRRQRLDEHREATKMLSEYKAADAIGIYRNTGVFKFSGSIGEARDVLIRDFTSEYIKYEKAGDTNMVHASMVALSYTNDEVGMMNSGIREKLKESGVVYGPEVEFDAKKGGGGSGKIKFAAGDKVVFGENDKWLGVFNGDTGKVIGFGKSKDRKRDVICVRLDNSTSVLGIDVPNVIEVDNHYYKSMEHGFAVNIYKSQGRTYDKVYALLDGHIGFHSFNVMATRHMSDLRIYVGDDVIEGELYKKISLDEVSAKETWHIKSDRHDPDSRRYAGLVAICQRRDNRSLSEDWRKFAETNEFRVLNDYVEVRDEVIKLSKEIDEWVRIQNLRGEMTKASEHEMYLALQESLVKRKDLAGGICDNYDSFGKLVVASNINYNTLEKHAGRGKYKYFFERRNSEVGCNLGVLSLKRLEGFEDTIKLAREFQSCDRGPLFEASGLGKDKALELSRDISSITGRMIEQFDEIRLDIAASRLSVDAASLEKTEAHNFVRDAGEYMETSIKSFLTHTYKDDAEVILERWASFRDKVITSGDGLDVAIAALKKNPQMLGSLKGVGLGSVLAFSTTRFRATVNMYEVSERLQKFEDYRQKLPVVNGDLWDEKYDEKIFEAVSQVSILEKSCVPASVEEFVHEMHNVMSKPNLSLYQERDILHALSWAKNSTAASKIDFYHEILEDKSGELIAKYEKLEKSSGATRQDTGHIGFSFDEVSRSLSSATLEEIFRTYAHVINPDGKIEKRGPRITVGSLGMDLKTGLWHRFSTGDGGNIFGFVREAKGGNIVDALEVVAGYGGLRPKEYDISNNISNILQVSVLKSQGLIQEPVNEWAPYSTVPQDASAFDINKHLKHLTHRCVLGGVYTYKNELGEVIGHTVRLISNSDGSKQVLPVAYCQNPALGESAWRLKGFEVYDASNNKYKPIYGFEKLQAEAHDDRPVLIVEGEKTADKAQELFPEYTVISWLGGTSNADKVNWSILQGREVIIWPDNDAVGKTAARVIADRINGKTGAIGKCAIITPESLEFGGKVHENMLPSRWDLADEIPKDITINDLKSALKNALDSAKSFDKAEMLSETKEDELDIRIIWQNRSAGLRLTESGISSIIAVEKAWNTILGSKEAKAYVQYAEARGILDVSHAFLKLDNQLYRESLVQVAILDKKLDISSDANTIDVNIPELLRDVQEKYEQKRDNFTDHIDCSKAHSDVLTSVSSDKGELIQILSRDVLLLHKLQLESGQLFASSDSVNVGGNKIHGQKVGSYRTVLCDIHKEKVVDDIYDIIKNYYGGSRGRAHDTNKLDDIDRVAIADKVYEKLNSSDWWKELAEVRLEMGGKTKALVSESDNTTSNSSTGRNIHNDVMSEIEKVYGGIFREIKEFDIKYDINTLKERLVGLKDILRDDVLKAEWISAFKAHVSPTLDTFAVAKTKAKNVGELLQIMDKEKQYCAGMKKSHYRAVLALYNREDDNRIMKVAMYYDESGGSKFVDHLKEDASNIGKFGIDLTKNEFNKLKNSMSHEEIAKQLFVACQDHAIDKTYKNIEDIKEYGYCKSGGIKFTSKYNYLQHEVERGAMSRYLKDTVHETTLHKIEEHTKAQEQIRLEAQMMQRQKSRGMEMDR